jgi:Mrp family chromosome partitioning ATPase
MVERLKEAIERARRERESRSADVRETPAPPVAAPDPRAVARAVRPAALWDDLPETEISAETLRRARIVTGDKSDPASTVFDMTRTRILKTCQQNGWRRIGFTSPSKHCGKSFVTLNLAFSFARNPALRCVVMDLDLQQPSINRALRGGAGKGAAALRHDEGGDVVKLLTGDASVRDVARKLRPNLALLGAEPTRNSAEILHNRETAAALDAVQAALEPDIMLVDLPPIFAGDDVLSVCGALDALAIVASAQHTTAREVLDAERIFSGYTAFLGVVLNKVEPGDAERYDYGYGTDNVA